MEYGPCRTQSKAMNHSWITYFSCPKRTRVLQHTQPSCFLRGWQEYYIFKILNRAADQHSCKCQPFSVAVVIKVVSLETFRDQQRCNMMVASRFNSGHARVLTNVWSQSSFPCVYIYIAKKGSLRRFESLKSVYNFQKSPSWRDPFSPKVEHEGLKYPGVTLEL